MNKWIQFDMENKIVEVLAQKRFESEHHFGRHFLTPYQIALELVRLHPELPSLLKKDVGGLGTGSQNSIAQYIAQRLSTIIKAEELTGIEGAFISNLHSTDLVYKDTTGNEVRSSNTEQEGLSLFRLR